MPDEEEVLVEVADVLREIMGVSPELVKLETSLVGDLGLDSLTNLELLGAVESIFGVTIPDAAARNFVVVGDVVAFISAS